ncbi:MAG: proline--tRNA ligase [Elusimicrobia bacterium]|nr:proline--tRNA ligase [Candidatus Liberimonas magnetica]
MKISKLFLPTLREVPADADVISAKLMLRSGMIRKVSSGIYEWLPLGLKVLKKVEEVVRLEMNAIGGQEVWFPLLLPKELWEETGRWNVYGKELFRIKDRKNSEFCLGPTHEEAVTDLVRRDVRSYRQLPLMLYQFGTKFRDEVRPRFGVMRAREFYMKDAYSFHADEKDAENYYLKAFEAYKKICERCGFKYRAVEATSGAIGGAFSHEFMVLAETGEEEIASCLCGYGANTEKTECIKTSAECQVRSSEQEQLQEILTPNIKTVEEVGAFLKEKPSQFIKTMIYLADGEPVIALVRGDYEINEHKLQSVLNCSILALADEQTIEKITGAPLGFAGPVKLKDNSVKIIADYSVEFILNGISGANRKDYHLVNININRDFKPGVIADIRKVVKGDACPRCNKELKFNRGIEVGHTFKLGTKYSKSMKAAYLDEQGKEKLMVMGCYGIGVSRIVAATIEQSNDENGIIWPVPLAPFEVIIVPINWLEENTRKTSEKLYNELLEKDIDVILDDREERAGMKFKDADLIGIPYRITISDRNLKDNKCELKARWEKKEESKLINVDEIVDVIIQLLKK